MSIAIRTDHLGKRYRLGAGHDAYGTLRDTLAAGARRAAGRLRGAPRSDQESFIWALDDVSLEVRSGEILGIIGPNGSGKSTLLKILARVTRPTVGQAWLTGRVGALLEVGTGFHPELTGRENVYLNAAILGMRRADINRRFDEIVAFAELERFLDTPVKRYSSGMYMRLAFSVAAHLDPDILIVDEVLAVGDAAFQRKCLGTMEGVARGGRTVLLVSHNMTAVQSLCNRVVWLKQGEIAGEGRPSDVVARYLETWSSDVREQVWTDPATAPGDDRIRLRRVAARPTLGSQAAPITMRTPVTVEIEYWNFVEGAHLDVNLQVVTSSGIVAFASSPAPGGAWSDRPFPVGAFRSTCCIPADLLIAGHHRLTVTISRDEGEILLQHPDALVVDVQDAPELRGHWYGEMVGVVRPLLAWTTELVDTDTS